MEGCFLRCLTSSLSLWLNTSLFGENHPVSAVLVLSILPSLFCAFPKLVFAFHVDCLHVCQCKLLHHKNVSVVVWLQGMFKKRKRCVPAKLIHGQHCLLSHQIV